MNKLKISDSDKRLLLIFFAIVIVACSYFFIFNKGMSKAAKIEEQNTTDRAKVQQMEQMEAGLPKVKENIQTMQKKQKDIIAAYPADMKTEKVIETLQEFEDKSSNFHITDVTFAMNMPIGADNSTAAADGSAAASTDRKHRPRSLRIHRAQRVLKAHRKTRQVRPEMWKGIMHRLASAMRQVMKD